jgi:hypothetical protein
MILSLKVSTFVYDNIVSLELTSENISLVDFEDSESEEKEIDELKKIVQSIKNNNSSTIDSKKSNSNYLFDNYNTTYLEYSTPPPELSL